jgi:hypothetical protein
MSANASEEFPNRERVVKPDHERITMEAAKKNREKDLLAQLQRYYSFEKLLQEDAAPVNGGKNQEPLQARWKNLLSDNEFPKFVSKNPTSHPRFLSGAVT